VLTEYPSLFPVATACARLVTGIAVWPVTIPFGWMISVRLLPPPNPPLPDAWMASDWSSCA